MIHKILFLTLSVIVFFSGCTINQPKQSGTNNYMAQSYSGLNAIINSLADQLKTNKSINFKTDKGTIAVTSFVDLNRLEKTTAFGRILGESMISELFRRGFNVSEFRGYGTISINKYGEFYITRDVSKLKNYVPNTYILVGTYAQIEDKTLLNVRIIDNSTGQLVASAREIYDKDYCLLSDNCGKKRIIRIVTNNMPKTICNTKICSN